MRKGLKYLFLISLFLSFTVNASNTCISGKNAIAASKTAYKKALEDIKEASKREENASDLLQKCLDGLKGINLSFTFPSAQFSLDKIIEKVCSMAVDKANDLIEENITNKINNYEQYINSISNNVDSIVSDINNVNTDKLDNDVSKITNSSKYY